MTPTRYITLLATGLVLWHAHPAAAQESGISVRISVASDSYEALSGIPIMVSVLRDGTILQQSERTYNNGLDFEVPPGVYDLRLEAGGAVTEVKRGITVTEGQWVQLIGGPMRAGEGLHVVEYATGGMTREELAVRLIRLEETMTSVQQILAELVQALKPPER